MEELLKTPVKTNPKATELIKRKDIPNTPFEIITQNGKSFGVMGKFRLTEFRKTPKEVEKELSELTWDRIIQVTSLLIDTLTENNKTKP